jgi:hypothetical protein
MSPQIYWLVCAKATRRPARLGPPVFVLVFGGVSLMLAGLLALRISEPTPELS